MSEEKSKKSNSGIYIAAFFLCVILIIMLFFVKKDDIVSNLKRTNFFERVGVSTPEFVSNHVDTVNEQQKQQEYEFDLMNGTSKTSVVEPEENLVPLEELYGQTEEKPSNTISGTRIEEKTPVSTQSVINDEKKPLEVKTQEKAKIQESATVVPSTRDTTLCFVNIDSDGKVARKTVVRKLPKSDSPLTDAIRALINGPLPSEGNCRTLIPSGTKLLGASVKNGVATLNFNENFEFNSFGVEGCIAQLMQIVYTATEFSTVKSVQFIIEGEKKDYMGTEGQWIGTPLSRASF